MHLNVIPDPTDDLSPYSWRDGADSPGDVRARSTTVNALAPRERIRGLVAARLFDGVGAPSRVGRFELQRELGVGGMGAVYAAHDPRLDRVVALKILQRIGGSGDGGQRLLREAQAMARLRHPNVVQVYEAGSHGEQVHIAMELIEGGTLGEWMGGRPRPWKEVREIMLAAGRGLAAAHAAGLVHRDFKPGNVLIDVDGQPRVSDFGLARGAEEENAGPEEAEETAEMGRGGLLELALTRTGAVLGTPAYMSPEQFRGEPATARSDQFAFCVVVWEALCGQRPFLSETMGGLLSQVESGTITPARGVRLPRKLRGILRRGLSPRPGDRYPSMIALLTDLERVPVSCRRGRLRTIFAGVMAASLAFGLALTSTNSDRAAEDEEFIGTPTPVAQGCLRTQTELSDAWSPAVRDGLRDRLASADGVRVDESTIRGVLGEIDERFESLREMHGDYCRAQVEKLDFSRMRFSACMGHRSQDFTSMLASLEEPTRLEIRDVEGLVSMLADESECSGEDPYAGQIQWPEDLVELWEARRSIAWAFAPGAATVSLDSEPSWAHAEELASRLNERRLLAELAYVKMVVAARGGATTVDPSLLESFMEVTAGSMRPINSPSGPMTDLRARAAVLLLEIYDRAEEPSSDHRRELAAAASAAVDELAAESRLRARLRLELDAL